MWLYNNTEFTDCQGFYGFIYCIVNLTTGKKYIGRKYFSKAKIQQKTKTRKRKKKLRVESDWLSYYGSNAELLEDVDKLGAHQFTRTILRLCKTRGECNYWEAKEILTRDALLRSDYYNKWVSLKLHRSTLVQLSNDSNLSSNAASLKSISSS